MSLKQQTTSILKSYGIKPVKYRGQCFLISGSVVKKIIAAADIKPGETVLEIGPGTGVLTQALLEAGTKVIAVEKDERLANVLSSKFQDPRSKKKTHIKIITDDVLHFDETEIKQSYKIVANIPYYITGKIIQKFLFSQNPPSEMILMVQKEVGERIASKPPRANYLSSLVQSFAEVKILFKVKKESFWPKPKVDSAVIRIAASDPVAEQARYGAGMRQGTRYKKQELEHYVRFLRIIFRQPRQTLWNNLRRAKIVPSNRLENVFKSLSLDKNIRGQNLTPKNLETLFDNIIQKIRMYPNAPNKIHIRRIRINL